MKYYQNNHKKTATWKTGTYKKGELPAPVSYEDFVFKFFLKIKEHACEIRKGERLKIFVHPGHYIIKTPRAPIYIMECQDTQKMMQWSELLKSEYPELIDKVSLMQKLTKDVGVVYFIEAVGTGFIKIGQTKDILKRLISLQTANPHELVLRKCITNARQEKVYHELYKDYHERGEWFRYEGELKKYIDSLPELSEHDGKIGVWHFNEN
jgi:hypothetical protein